MNTLERAQQQNRRYHVNGKNYNVYTVTADNNTMKVYTRVRSDMFNNKTFSEIKRVYSIKK